jgi:hypothetical protein
LINSAEISLTGTIPSSAVLLSVNLVPHWSAVLISLSNTRLTSFTKNASNQRSLLSEYELWILILIRNMAPYPATMNTADL